jgi:DNA repair protein RadC
VGPDDAVKFYQAHFRFFESDEKNIDHPTPIQGRWKVNAIHLPREVLRKLYYDNAEKLIFARKVTIPVVDPVEDKPATGT